MDKITIAIIVRGQYDEMPFLNEFIHYHITRGFDRIYFVNTDQQKQITEQILLPSLSKFVSLINYPYKQDNWQEMCLNSVLGDITEEWTLAIDMDEFVHLPSGIIKTFLRNLPKNISKVHIPWLMCLSREYSHSSVFEICKFEKYKSASFKTIAKTKEIEYLELHDVEIKNNSKENSLRLMDYEQIFIIHFASRGILDLINRIIGRNYQNEKSGAGEEKKLYYYFSNKTCPEHLYPFRFLLYRLELTFPKIRMKIEINNIDEITTDVSLLKKIVAEKLNSIGVIIPMNEIAVLDKYLEEKYALKFNLLKFLPIINSYREHFNNLRSYTNLTKDYLESLLKSNNSI